jgi:hypothetical protein
VPSPQRRLHLACFFDADSHPLARHFVRHYATVVGVRLERMTFWVHAHLSAEI